MPGKGCQIKTQGCQIKTQGWNIRTPFSVKGILLYFFKEDDSVTFIVDLFCF